MQPHIRMRKSVHLFVTIALGLLASIGTLLGLLIGAAKGAANLPQGFTDSPVVSGLTNPMDMEFAPDGRLFVAEQAGKVLIAEPDGTLATFLDISEKVDSNGDRGLQALAFFRTSHFVYLHYTMKATATTPVHDRIVRVTARGDQVVAGSEKLIFRFDDQKGILHFGGAIDFDKAGKLYVATGDDDNPTNAQQLTNIFGKMLRINKNGTIPKNNPFYNTTSGNNRAIWALGLRNPFRFDIQPRTGTIFINDVGGNPPQPWEEINRGAAGANYGWPVHEGVANDPSYVDPIFAYEHIGDFATTGCAITGGAFYNPATLQFPQEYEGDYFFADFCHWWIRSFDPVTGEASGFATDVNSPIDLEVSKEGELYYLSRGAGLVGKIGYAGT
jgi:glucose/arabinose dehydrogenase